MWPADAGQRYTVDTRTRDLVVSIKSTSVYVQYVYWLLDKLTKFDSKMSNCVKFANCTL